MPFDVIETLVLGLKSRLQERDDLNTEATPELALPVVANATVSRQSFELVLVREAMVLPQMMLEPLFFLKRFGAMFVRSSFNPMVAPPELRLKMLTILMAFPVVLAAKSLCASKIRTSIWPLMPLLMLSGTQGEQTIVTDKALTLDLTSHHKHEETICNILRILAHIPLQCLYHLAVKGRWSLTSQSYLLTVTFLAI